MANTDKFFDIRMSNGQLPAYAWPGGYPLAYYMDDGEALCPTCVNDPTNPIHQDGEKDGWRLECCDINYENNNLFCAHCNQQIESAYGGAE